MLTDLIKAFTIASGVRETVSSSFEDRNLDDLFADVEVFLITFPDMSKVKDAAVSLVVSVMKAIEDAIGFFISNQSMFMCRHEKLHAQFTTYNFL